MTKKFSSKENNLNPLLMQIFKHIEKEIKIFPNPSVVEYHKKFFDNFSLPVLRSHHLLNHNNLRLRYIEQFNRVSDSTLFKYYLKSIPGLYPKLVLWAIKNPFPNNTKSIKVKHHVMPKFLTTQRYELNQMKTVLKIEQIESEYNIITVNFVIHFVMHLVRLIDYRQPGDFLALRMLLNQPTVSKNGVSLKYELRVNNALKSIFYECFCPHWCSCYPEFQKYVPTEKKNN